MEGSDTTVEQVGQDGGQEDGGQGGIDFSPVYSRFDAIADRMDDLEARLTPEPQQPGYGVDQYGAPLAQGFDPAQGDLQGPDVYDEQGQVDPQMAQAWLAQQERDQQLGQMQSELRVMAARNDARDLESKYPELKNPEVAGPVWERVQAQAHAMGDPDAALNPGFIELVYQAWKAGERAGQETPVGAGGEPAHLEGAGGNAGSVQEVDPAERIASISAPKGPAGQFWMG